MEQQRAERDEPVQKQERFAFHGQSASGYARQHNGNVYNNHYYKYSIQKRRSDETLRVDQRNKQLLKAAAAGHTPRVRYLIHLGVDLDFSDDEAGFTALHHAALSGFEDTMEVLLSAGADVAAQSLDHGTPLHLAALKGRLNVVQQLLSFRADPNEQSHAVGRPLHCACAAASLNVVRELLAKHAAVDSSATVDFRVVYSNLSVTDRDWRARTWNCQPLLVATICGSRDVFAALLAAGALADEVSHLKESVEHNTNSITEKPLPREPFNMDPRSDLTPLRFSIRYGLLEITQLILESGVSKKNIAAAFVMAAYIGDDKTLALLLEYVDSPDIADGFKDTALMGAAGGGHLETAQLLVRSGASINLLTTRTALHAAIQSGYAYIVSSLLRWGADPQLMDANGRNGLAYARYRRAPKPICELL